jgi:Alginate lyase
MIGDEAPQADQDGEATRAYPTGPASSAPPDRHRLLRRSAAVVAVAAVAITALGASLVAGRPPSTGLASPTAGDPSSTSGAASTDARSSPFPTAFLTGARGYLADRSDLIQRAALAQTGVEPYATAFDDLMTWARKAVRRDPRPAERLRIKGTEGPFVDDTATAYGLALAHALTGERDFGEAAARYIMAWVDTTKSTRNTCPKDGSCQTSLIISRTVPGFVFAADMLEDSGYLDDASRDRLRVWLRDVMLPTASELDNNWGDAGTFTRIALTDYLEDQAGFDAAIKKWRELLDLVKADGHIPAEVARESGGLGYTQEALDYKIAVAVIAERRGVDLWDYEGAAGGSLKEAVDYLAQYMTRPDHWPWYDAVRRRPPSALWELAYSHWRDPDHAALVMEGRPYGSDGHSAVRWTTITNGVPIDGS